MKKGDLLIAIRDAPPFREHPNNTGARSYHKGDKFEFLRESIEDPSEYKIWIQHPKFGEFYVIKENFQLFSEYRESILSKIMD